jgi:uroporphyrinogen-III synthase
VTAPVAILVTRPADQAHALLARLAELGFEAVPFPLLETLASRIPESQLGWARRLDAVDVIVFVSANAVRYGLPVLRRYWWPLPGSLCCLAVGPGTARVLADDGVSASVPATATSEGLLDLPELREVRNRRVLIVRGQGGRELLRQQLAARGALVHYLEVYRRDRTGRTASDLERITSAHESTLALITSGEALVELNSLVAGAAQRARLSVVVASQRIAGMARELGFPRVHLAQGAGDDQMLAAVAAVGSGQESGSRC